MYIELNSYDLFEKILIYQLINLFKLSKNITVDENNCFIDEENIFEFVKNIYKQFFPSCFMLNMFNNKIVIILPSLVAKDYTVKKIIYYIKCFLKFHPESPYIFLLKQKYIDNYDYILNEIGITCTVGNLLKIPLLTSTIINCNKTNDFFKITNSNINNQKFSVRDICFFSDLFKDDDGSLYPFVCDVSFLKLDEVEKQKYKFVDIDVCLKEGYKRNNFDVLSDEITNVYYNGYKITIIGYCFFCQLINNYWIYQGFYVTEEYANTDNINCNNDVCVTTLDNNIHSFLIGKINANKKYQLLSSAQFVLKQIKYLTNNNNLKYKRYTLEDLKPHFSV